jgi:hypothetical protein
MKISPQDAVSLLRKWQQERRMIQASLIFSATTNCCAIGRLEHVDAQPVRIDARSIDRIGHHRGLLLDLSEAKGFNFHDSRDAPPDYAEQLQQAYEAFLFIELDGCLCEIYAAKTGDEINGVDLS